MELDQLEYIFENLNFLPVIMNPKNTFEMILWNDLKNRFSRFEHHSWNETKGKLLNLFKHHQTLLQC